MKLKPSNGFVSPVTGVNTEPVADSKTPAPVIAQVNSVTAQLSAYSGATIPATATEAAPAVATSFVMFEEHFAIVGF